MDLGEEGGQIQLLSTINGSCVLWDASCSCNTLYRWELQREQKVQRLQGTGICALACSRLRWHRIPHGLRIFRSSEMINPVTETGQKSMPSWRQISRFEGKNLCQCGDGTWNTSVLSSLKVLRISATLAPNHIFMDPLALITNSAFWKWKLREK